MSLQSLSQSLRPDFFTIPNNFYSTHYHEILYSFIFYNALFLVCPVIGKITFKQNYTALNRKQRLNFDIHIIAMIQCLISIVACVPLLLQSQGPDNSYAMGQDFGSTNASKLFGYNYNFSFVGAITTGYFIWDLLVCLQHFDLFGFSFLLHAFAALFVFSITLIPFFQYWIPRFLIFELSSPFVNINWFVNKLPQGTIPKQAIVINGLLLLGTFFSVRIVWGFYAIYLVLSLLIAEWGSLSLGLKGIASMVVLLNFLLDVLNLFWFTKMIKIAKKMAAGSGASKKGDKVAARKEIGEEEEVTEDLKKDI